MELPKRKKIRLEGYDYSRNGYYYITMCVKDRHELLGKITETDGGDFPHIVLSQIGQCLEETIQKANKDAVRIDKYVIMPNHVHMIVVLQQATDGRGRSSLQQIVKNIKSFVTKQAGFSLWQNRFYDHIIRSEQAYQEIWRYIDENPAKWMEDKYYTGV